MVVFIVVRLNIYYKEAGDLRVSPASLSWFCY